MNQTHVQEKEIKVGDQIRIWEEDALEKMMKLHGRSFGSRHVEVGGGEVRHLDHLRPGDVKQSERERSFGLNHVEDGGGAAQRLDHAD
jgi:hypothetical protein